jgi:hypothetical protein
MSIHERLHAIIRICSSHLQYSNETPRTFPKIQR